MTRDKTSLDIFWLKDNTLAASDNLPPPPVIAPAVVSVSSMLVNTSTSLARFCTGQSQKGSIVKTTLQDPLPNSVQTDCITPLIATPIPHARAAGGSEF
jgi:hypothetical protein